MYLTIYLTLISCLLLTLLIILSAIFIPFGFFAAYFPKDTREILRRKSRNQSLFRRVLGVILIILLIVSYIAVTIYGGIDGLRHQYSLAEFFERFMIIGYGTKIYEIAIIDYLLTTKLSLFQRLLPETKDCEGWRHFGYNRDRQIRQMVFIPIGCLISALVFTII